jgi:hypothetical protein
MLSPSEMLTMLVGLEEVNDLDLVEDDAVLMASCADEDRETVRSMAAIIEGLYEAFDYEHSPEFQDKVSGKSEQVQTMHRKLLDPSKRKDALQRLGVALTQVLTSDDAFTLIPSCNHSRLTELRKLTQSLQQP